MHADWARWDAFISTVDPDALFDEFRQRGAAFVTELSFIDDGEAVGRGRGEIDEAATQVLCGVNGLIERPLPWL
jgi:hypothetical protein